MYSTLVKADTIPQKEIELYVPVVCCICAKNTSYLKRKSFLQQVWDKWFHDCIVCENCK